MARRGDSTVPVRTIFLRAGRSSAIHRHDEQSAWLHVVAGEIVEERWTRDAEGGFVHERRRLEAGQSMAAPADVLHRITATEDAAFVSTCVCDCARAQPACPTEIEAVMLLSRSCADDRAWAIVTATGEPSPSGREASRA